MQLIALSRGRALARVDDDAYEQLIAYAWTITPAGYAMRRAKARGVSRTIYMHREIVGAAVGQIVDHINGDRTDNQRHNLRLCTNAQNMANAPAYRGRRFRGVHWRASRGKWRASIAPDGRSIHLGLFDTVEAAARAYDAAARTHFKEFAHVNFPQEG